MQKEKSAQIIAHFNLICAIIEKKSAFIGRKFNLFLQKVHFNRKNLNKTEIVKRMRSTAQISSIFAGLFPFLKITENILLFPYNELGGRDIVQCLDSRAQFGIKFLGVASFVETEFLRNAYHITLLHCVHLKRSNR